MKFSCIFSHFCSLQSVIERELLDNLKAYEFELTEDEMQKIFGLNKNLRKIVPVNKLKDGSVVLRDGKSRHFPFHYEEKMWIKIEIQISLFSKGKNAWNIHKFMGHKRESQSWRKKWIKKFSKKKNPISNFYFSPCRKSFPICINYHYIAMTSSNITYESRMEVCTPISHVLTFTSS